MTTARTTSPTAKPGGGVTDVLPRRWRVLACAGLAFGVVPIVIQPDAATAAESRR